jgi:hypothetical protein
MATGKHDLHKDEVVYAESIVVGGNTAVTAPVAGVAGGYKIARSSSAMVLDGSNPTSFEHGLTTCVAAFATLASSIAPGDGTNTLSVVINSSLIDIYAWAHLSTDHTLVASTGAESITWLAIGT